MKKIAISLYLLAALPSTSSSAELLTTAPLEKHSKEEVILQGAQPLLNRQYTETFPLAATLDSKGWYSVDLKPKCNLNLFSNDGKTCPVKFLYMSLGRQVFYGVPFHVISPGENANRTAIALPSTRLLPKALPASVEVAVGRKAAVLYFLVATYYTIREGDQHFTLNYADGSSHKMQFIGTVHSGDWYHQHTRIYTDDVRCVLAPATKGSKTFHRNMHVVQWKNPHKEKTIRSITLTSDPSAPMAILVTAISGHPG